MPRPGTDVVIVDEAPARGAILTTGQAFMVGVAERGPIDRAVEISGIADYRTQFGSRPGGVDLYDGAYTFFNEGGAILWVSRAAGAGALPSEVTTGDLTVTARSPGAWGDTIGVAYTTTGSVPNQVTVMEVRLDGETVERSPSVGTNQELSQWAATFSDYVTITVDGDVLPTAAENATLTGGADGGAPAAGDLTAALERFGEGLGPGQVLAPGFTDTASHEAVLAHLIPHRRVALLDAPDGDAAAKQTAVEALHGIEGVRYAQLVGPRIDYPGEVSPSVISVAYSPIQAALIAKTDLGGNPNVSAAGVNGQVQRGLGLTEEFSDAERTTLNDAGVTLAKLKYGGVRTYGIRTAAGPTDVNWLWFANSRTVMAIAAECDAAAENYVFGQIDGRGQIFAKLETELRGICLRYHNLGALYGEEPPQAFDVDTSSAVNTIDTIKKGEVHAVVRVKFSPGAEWVEIQIVKVPPERAI